MKTMKFNIHKATKVMLLLAVTHGLVGCHEPNTSQAQTASLFSSPAPPPPPTPDTNGKIRIGLLLDTSTSMDGLIEQTKSQLWKIVNELTKARYDGQAPSLEIALYEYGNDNLSAESGYICQVSPMTSELDLISEHLFALSTRGGSEYCGQVIKTALEENDWSNEAGELNILFIAGNEEFIQGKVDYKDVCRAAKAKGITVNTIFCGERQVGINQEWQRGADLGGGQYMSLEQNRKTQYVSTPYDQRIDELNRELNTTYLSYGRRGKMALQNQIAQDNNAMSYGMSNNSFRAISKSSKAYTNVRWDLVDASNEKEFDITKVERQYLDKNLQKLSDDELEKKIQEQQKRREQIQAEIRLLGAKRAEFVKAARKESGQDGGFLDDIMINAIHAQGAARNFTFEDELTAMETEAEPAKRELQPSAVDYPGFNDLTERVASIRQVQKVGLDEFLKMAKDPGTILLDTRSKAMYDAKHLMGAIHLNFSDFTAEKLAQVIPSKETRVLIYCNNNIIGDPKYFAMKSQPLALNIPTFINLVGYGYENVYELADNVPIGWLQMEGTAVATSMKRKM